MRLQLHALVLFTLTASVRAAVPPGRPSGVFRDMILWLTDEFSGYRDIWCPMCRDVCVGRSSPLAQKWPAMFQNVDDHLQRSMRSAKASGTEKGYRMSDCPKICSEGFSDYIQAIAQAAMLYIDKGPYLRAGLTEMQFKQAFRWAGEEARRLGCYDRGRRAPKGGPDVPPTDWGNERLVDGKVSRAGFKPMERKDWWESRGDWMGYYAQSQHLQCRMQQALLPENTLTQCEHPKHAPFVRPPGDKGNGNPPDGGSRSKERDATEKAESTSNTQAAGVNGGLERSQTTRAQFSIPLFTDLAQLSAKAGTAFSLLPSQLASQVKPQSSAAEAALRQRGVDMRRMNRWAGCMTGCLGRVGIGSPQAILDTWGTCSTQTCADATPSLPISAASRLDTQKSAQEVVSESGNWIQQTQRAFGDAVAAALVVALVLIRLGEKAISWS